MDNAQDKTLQSTGKTLIDILYKDDYRIKSYIAQMLAGAVQSVKKQTTSSDGSYFRAEGNAAIFKGDYQKNQTESGMTETQADIHDYAVQLLLEELNLPVHDTLSAQWTDGTIMHLTGEAALRDFKSFEDILSVIASSPSLFEMAKKDMKQMQILYKAIAKIIPLNLEAEIVLSDGCLLRGILKEDYMLTPYRDLISMHGPKLPGKWHIIGILDHTESSQSALANNFRSSMDVMANAVKSIYNNDESHYAITPFLIYRELKL